MPLRLLAGATPVGAGSRQPEQGTVLGVLLAHHVTGEDQLAQERAQLLGGVLVVEGRHEIGHGVGLAVAHVGDQLGLDVHVGDLRLGRLVRLGSVALHLRVTESGQLFRDLSGHIGVGGEDKIQRVHIGHLGHGITLSGFKVFSLTSCTLIIPQGLGFVKRVSG